LDERDVVIIGGGPAGFMAAQRIVMLGGKATVVEKERVGGICPNWGCIPMCFMDHCVEVLRSAIDYRVIPHFIRTLPPIASVGITESEANARGLNIKVGRCPFETSPKANILRESRGLVKLISEASTGEILGVHIIGA
jgi:pyruvate/2-oxoglutarate dehydrogenase complex dihydrolipoamide dehydrogenase (E3) component